MKNLVFAVFLLFFACKSPEKLVKMERLDNYKIEDVNFKYLSTKSRLIYADENNKQNVRVNIRIAKDSLIWASLRAAGVEGMRVLFTKDSILIMDKIEKNYYIKTFQQISRQINHDINFQIVQSLIVGSLPFEIPENANYERKKDVFQRKFRKNDIEIDIEVSRFFARITQLVLKQEDSNNKLKLDYSDFRQVGNTVFPHESKANIKYHNQKTELKTEISLTHSEIELNEVLEFPFTVSDSYTKIE